eukprot:TRINITY_DN2756_c0_g1_i2.p1 TRINITY_DN2756_c0_g1~~TRINITY_DN2756_c0_g1_i2.p1  ORF type:complete len:146 (+),score=33.28 TRINITY_DN2756_c0_g1_i2:72-509(+)
MGSLMAGWDSPVPAPKDVKYQKNRSFTKAEIEAYWKSKKRREEEHLRAVPELLQNSQESIYEESTPKLQRSSSVPLTGRREESLLIRDPKTDLEKLKKRNDWWTSSNWAFLNEPPVTAMEGPSYKYASQYHVADEKPGLQSRLTT